MRSVVLSYIVVHETTTYVCITQVHTLQWMFPRSGKGLSEPHHVDWDLYVCVCVL